MEHRSWGLNYNFKNPESEKGVFLNNNDGYDDDNNIDDDDDDGDDENETNL